MPEQYTTYSFQDVNAIILHPKRSSYAINGQGVGSINIVMANDVTTHDVAADSTVMVSKINVNNGSISITTQQTSSLHRWLLDLYNYLKQAATDEWASISMLIRCPKLRESTIATGVSFLKKADKVYEPQGQMVTWAFLGADIEQTGF